MIFIDNEGINDPHLNLALEEYIVRNFKNKDYLLFYINEPSIIIGRNQNTLEEVNQSYVEEKGIHVVRRISGGGAVYHDFGNLNFSFITDHDIKSFNNFKKVTAPIVKVLNDMGVKAEMKGRNDVVVDDKKISGNAQFSTGKRMFTHGTLLLNSDLEEVTRALQVKMSKISSKGHKSVRSRVANIQEFLNKPLDILEFRELILKGLDAAGDFETYRLSKEEWKEVHELKESKYDQWDWNYGRSPKSNIQREKRFPIGIIDLRLWIEKGHIANVKIYGDFFNSQPISELEEILTGIRYTKEDVHTALKEVDLSKYFNTLSKEDFENLVYGEDDLIVQ